MTSRMTVGEHLIHLLEEQGVDTVFGIPGVHTAELYRGLSASQIRHITPRGEQEAGFMADGYARASGRPGVCLLITGPGLTNAITPMAQAKADSIPLLVISAVNARATLGHYSGHLHELPDQAAMIQTLDLPSERLERPEDLAAIVQRAFAAMRQGRPGPAHIEIPIDLMEVPATTASSETIASRTPAVDAVLVGRAADLCARAQRPLILAGGGAAWADTEIRELAERLDAPVVTTTNARGILAAHPLSVPASPSLPSVRELMQDSDLVVAIGTQFGPTDYDAYSDGGFVMPRNLIRIDIDPQADKASDSATLAICADARDATRALSKAVEAASRDRDGARRAAATRERAFNDLTPKMKALIEVLGIIRDTLPGCLMVGDSTQLAYAGNLYWDAAAPRSWFNAATGYGALGFGPPAAVGASIALEGAPVVCLVGDGGFQFCLGALGTAADENAPVIFVVWNNHGYQEIEDYMVSREITPIGVRPGAPDFTKMAEAYGIPAERIRLTSALDQAGLAPGELDLQRLAQALRTASKAGGPALIEIITP